MEGPAPACTRGQPFMGCDLGAQAGMLLEKQPPRTSPCSVSVLFARGLGSQAGAGAAPGLREASSPLMCSEAVTMTEGHRDRPGVWRAARRPRVNLDPRGVALSESRPPPSPPPPLSAGTMAVPSAGLRWRSDGERAGEPPGRASAGQQVLSDLRYQS